VQTHDDAALFDLATRVGARLAAEGARLVTVESCTGGWIAKALTDVAGSSAWLEAGFVTYGNAAKERLVGVTAQTLARDGAVSEAAVREMATGGLRSTGVDRSVAVSGIAGPAGGTPDKPVGTVWLAWGERRGGTVAVRTRHLRLDGDRERIRRQAVAAALEGLLVEPAER
jgi:nicotinamide-nucleotide amidase